MARRRTADVVNKSRDVLSRLGINRGDQDLRAKSTEVNTTSSLATGQLMNQRQAYALIENTVNEAGFLTKFGRMITTNQSGNIPKMAFNRPITRGADEAVSQTHSRRPSKDDVPYDVAKLHSTLYWSTESAMQAAATGEHDLARKLFSAVSKACGNDAADLVVNGDEDLPATTDDNLLRRVQDGILKQIKGGRGRWKTTDRGKPFAPGLLYAMKRRMDRRWRSNPNNMWLWEEMLDLAWRENRTNAGDTSGIITGDRATTSKVEILPLGENILRVPKIATDQGFDTLAATQSNADTVVDGGGSITFTIDTIVGGSSVDATGRIVRITHISSGETEDVVVVKSGGANKATTQGTLGQVSVSTTASHYTVDFADCTTALYCDPANVQLVFWGAVRAFYEFEQDADRYRIDVYWHMDIIILEPDAMVMQQGISLPAPGSEWEMV